MGGQEKWRKKAVLQDTLRSIGNQGTIPAQGQGRAARTVTPHSCSCLRRKDTAGDIFGREGLLHEEGNFPTSVSPHTEHVSWGYGECGGSREEDGRDCTLELMLFPSGCLGRTGAQRQLPHTGLGTVPQAVGRQF